MRSPEFYEALSTALESMQAAPTLEAAFEALTQMLKPFALRPAVLETHPDGSFTFRFTALGSRRLRTFEQLIGFDPFSYVGRAEQVAFMREVLDTRRAVFVGDVIPAITEALGFSAARPIASRVQAALNIEAFVAAPLMVSGEIAGILLILGENDLTPDDIPSINILATQLSANWQSSRAAASLLTPGEKLRLVAQISREAAAFPDLEQMLQRTLRHLHAALPGEYACIALVEDGYAVVSVESFKGETYRPASEKARHRLRVGQEGVIGYAAGEGKTLLANDVRLEPRYVADPDLPNIRSEVAVPLQFRDQVLGVLDVEAETPGVFNQADVELLEAVAGQLGTLIALDNLRKKSEALGAELSALTVTSEMLVSTLPLHERLTRIAEQAHLMLHAQGIAIHLSRDGLPGQPQEVVALDLPDLSTEVTRLAEEVVSAEQRERPAVYAPLSDLIASASVGRWALFSLPLRLEGRTLGAITVVRPSDRPLAEIERRRLNNFARQAALAASHARLVEQHNRQKQLAETLSVVSRVVGSSHALDDMLDTILNALGEVVPHVSSSIMLFEAGKLALANTRSITDEELKAYEGVDWTKFSTVRQLIAQRRPLIVSNTDEDSTWRAFPVSEYIKSWIGIPLISRGNLIGILNVNSDQPGTYQVADGTFLLAFANQIATALDNAIMLHETERRQVEARALYETTRMMVSTTDVGEMVKQVLAAIRQIIPYDVSALLRVLEFLPEEPFQIEVYTPVALDEHYVSLARQQILESYRILASTLLSRRVTQLDLHGTATGPDEEQLPSRLSVPLLVGERLQGLIELGSLKPGAYDENHLRVLFTIANPLATALENAALVDALRARARELEETSRLKDEVVQNISHELRNPLTFVRGYVQLLLDGDLGQLNDDQTRSLEVLYSKTETLIRLVNDIITLNTVSAETLERELVDVNKLVESSARGVEGSATANGMQITVEVPDTPQMALVDTDRLNQVIDNLLGNALKFSEEGDTITARVLDLGEQVRIEIVDEGLGIAPEIQSRIFERFFQADTSLARKRRGVGLGLAISKQIVEALGGTIGVESVPGQGSTFYVELKKSEEVSPG